MQSPTAAPVSLRVANPPSSERGRFKRQLFERGVGWREASPKVRAYLGAAAWAGFSLLLVAENPAVARRRVRAMATFVACEALRFRGRPYVVDLGPRGRLLCPPWSAMGAVTGATGWHEPWEERFVLDVVRPGEVVIDAGANIGFYTIPLVHRGARVLAIEPSDQAASVLQQNLGLNDVAARSCRLLPIALSDFDGVGHVTVGLDVQNHLVDADEPGSQETLVRRLDTLLKDEGDWFGGDRVAVLKVDCEGHDEQVLRGGHGIISGHRPVILIELHHGTRSPIRDLLTAEGYRIYWYDVDRRELVALPEEWQGNYQFHSTMIAVHDTGVAGVLARCRSAVRGDDRPPRIRPWSDGSTAHPVAA